MKIILIFLLAMSGVCAAQQINPSQIRPCATNGNLLGTVSGVTSCVPPPTTTGVITGTGTSGYIPQWTGTSTQGNSPIDSGITHSGAITITDPTYMTGNLYGQNLFYHYIPGSGSAFSAGDLQYAGHGVFYGAYNTTDGSTFTPSPFTVGQLQIAPTGAGILFFNEDTINAGSAPIVSINGYIAEPTGVCPNIGASFNAPQWAIAADDTLSYCSNTLSSTWQLYSPGGGGTGLSGMTSGQVPIANSATTANASKAIAGSGAGLTSGPTTSTSGDCAQFTGTAGQISDSGSPCGGGGGSPSTPLLVSCNTSGDVTFTETSVNSFLKIVVGYANNCAGEAVFNLPVAYTNQPSCVVQNGTSGTVASCGPGSNPLTQVLANGDLSGGAYTGNFMWFGW